MSSDCHKPTYVFDAGAYNATEVRLYGKLPQTMFPARVGDEEYDIDVKVKNKNDKGKNGNKPHNPTNVLAIDVKSFTNMYTFIISGFKIVDKKIETQDRHSIGVIFGYAFEGHCYDLPKPKIMLLPVGPSPEIPDDDCGYKAKEAEGYVVWVVDKLDKCVEFEVNQGFVEQLVLDANLPGKRSPSTYRATMVVSHRGGRLTD